MVICKLEKNKRRKKRVADPHLETKNWSLNSTENTGSKNTNTQQADLNDSVEFL